MKNAGWIWRFLLGIWEFWLWAPNEINTILEKLILLALRDLSQLYPLGIDNPSLIFLLNPGMAIVLYLFSINHFVDFIRGVLYQYVNARWIILTNRHGVIRVLIAGVIFLVVLQQALNFTSNAVSGLIDLYQNKMFWVYILGGITLYKLVAPGGKNDTFSNHL